MRRDTGVQCPLCGKGTILAEVESIATESPMNIPIGPASLDYYRNEVTSFYCSNCCVLFHHPPGNPDAGDQVLRSLREEV